jgi:hypothetical protein
MRRIHLSDLMLMAGVLNSEVEKSVRHLTGAPPGSKCALQFSANTLEIRALATKRHTADP